MIRVTSRDVHDPAAGIKGDCWRASLASLLEMRLADVPAFQLMPDFVTNWWWPTVSFLEVKNWCCQLVNWQGQQASIDQAIEIAHELQLPTVMSGPSPRLHDTKHCVAFFRGELWDPHPSRAGIGAVDDMVVLFNGAKEDLDRHLLRHGIKQVAA